MILKKVKLLLKKKTNSIVDINIRDEKGYDIITCIM